jgi:hypothetical protein
MMALLALLVGAGFDLQTSEEARLACLAVIVSAFPWAALTFRHINRTPISTMKAVGSGSNASVASPPSTCPSTT